MNCDRAFKGIGKLIGGCEIQPAVIDDPLEAFRRTISSKLLVPIYVYAFDCFQGRIHPPPKDSNF